MGMKVLTPYPLSNPPPLEGEGTGGGDFRGNLNMRHAVRSFGGACQPKSTEQAKGCKGELSVLQKSLFEDVGTTHSSLTFLLTTNPMGWIGNRGHVATCPYNRTVRETYIKHQWTIERENPVGARCYVP